MTTADNSHLFDIEPPAPAPAPAAPVPARKKGGRLSSVALVGAVVMAAALGLSSFLFLAELDPVSLSPFEGTAAWFVLLLVGLFGTALVFLLAVLAVFVCRPRTTAVLALCAALVLPAAALTVGTLAGVETLRRNTTADLADGGTATLTAFSGTLRMWGVEPEPLLAVLREQ